jgi:hypothetical protein
MHVLLLGAIAQKALGNAGFDLEAWLMGLFHIFLQRF